jgi:dolichol-phosphate mannosyltransferase
LIPGVATPGKGDALMPYPAFTHRLSVVVPVHNEADNIEPLAHEIAAALEGRVEYEIIIVDDGSYDATPQQLAVLARALPQLRVLRHRESYGQSQAVSTGVRHACYDWIATLDGDGQNDPADLPVLLDHLQTSPATGLALIAGWRTARHDSWLRRVSSRVANGVRARLLRDATPDTGCGLKLFGRSTYLDLPNFDHMHRFLPALVQRNGYRVESVPVRHRPREYGRSKYGIHNRLWVGIVDLFGVAWLQRRVRLPRIDDPAADLARHQDAR